MKDTQIEYDPFESVVDLKPLVLRRLSQHFPELQIGLAADPTRMVRMTFQWARQAQETSIYGHFQNCGIGPARDVEYGVSSESLGCADDPILTGALNEGDRLQTHDGKEQCFRVPPDSESAVVYCEYENRFGDRYRVEQLFSRKQSQTPSQLLPNGRERVFTSVAGRQDWIEMRPTKQ